MSLYSFIDTAPYTERLEQLRKQAEACDVEASSIREQLAELDKMIATKGPGDSAPSALKRSADEAALDVDTSTLQKRRLGVSTASERVAIVDIVPEAVDLKKHQLMAALEKTKHDRTLLETGIVSVNVELEHAQAFNSLISTANKYVTDLEAVMSSAQTFVTAWTNLKPSLSIESVGDIKKELNVLISSEYTHFVAELDAANKQVDGSTYGYKPSTFRFVHNSRYMEYVKTCAAFWRVNQILHQILHVQQLKTIVDQNVKVAKTTGIELDAKRSIAPVPDAPFFPELKVHHEQVVKVVQDTSIADNELHQKVDSIVSVSDMICFYAFKLNVEIVSISILLFGVKCISKSVPLSPADEFKQLADAYELCIREKTSWETIQQYKSIVEQCHIDDNIIDACAEVQALKVLADQSIVDEDVAKQKLDEKLSRGGVVLGSEDQAFLARYEQTASVLQFDMSINITGAAFAQMQKYADKDLMLKLKLDIAFGACRIFKAACENEWEKIKDVFIPVDPKRKEFMDLATLKELITREKYGEIATLRANYNYFIEHMEDEKGDAAKEANDVNIKSVHRRFIEPFDKIKLAADIVNMLKALAEAKIRDVNNAYARLGRTSLHLDELIQEARELPLDFNSIMLKYASAAPAADLMIVLKAIMEECSSDKPDILNKYTAASKKRAALKAAREAAAAKAAEPAKPTKTTAAAEGPDGLFAQDGKDYKKEDAEIAKRPLLSDVDFQSIKIFGKSPTEYINARVEHELKKRTSPDALNYYRNMVRGKTAKKWPDVARIFQFSLMRENEKLSEEEKKGHVIPAIISVVNETVASLKHHLKQKYQFGGARRPKRFI